MTENKPTVKNASVGRIPVSVLILTLDEEINIRGCIEALEWTDDIVVLDSFSKDATVEIAESLGARIYTRKFDNFASQRNFALTTIAFKHEWVLHLDADEVVTPELRDELASVVKTAQFDAYQIPSKMMFMGTWLRYAGMYPTYQVRLGRLDSLRFEQVGHGQRENMSPESVGTFVQPYLHFCFSKGIGDWIEKHNRYSTDEARHGVELLGKNRIDWLGLFQLPDKTRRRRALKGLAVRLPFRPALRFFYMYVLKRGFLDGWAGLVYCRLLAGYEYWILLKMRELAQKSPY